MVWMDILRPGGRKPRDRAGEKLPMSSVWGAVAQTRPPELAALSSQLSCQSQCFCQIQPGSVPLNSPSQDKEGKWKAKEFWTSPPICTERQKMSLLYWFWKGKVSKLHVRVINVTLSKAKVVKTASKEGRSSSESAKRGYKYQS